MHSAFSISFTIASVHLAGAGSQDIQSSLRIDHLKSPYRFRCLSTAAWPSKLGFDDPQRMNGDGDIRADHYPDFTIIGIVEQLEYIFVDDPARGFTIL